MPWRSKPTRPTQTTTIGAPRPTSRGDAPGKNTQLCRQSCARQRGRGTRKWGRYAQNAQYHRLAL
eukprot:5576028-Lingulodinium_polyedra.AAC.1